MIYAGGSCLFRRDTIIYIPYYEKGAQTNEYIVHMIQLLRRKFIVKGNMAEPTDVCDMLRTKAVFLNWEEEHLDKKKKFQICLYKMFGAKIIWVLHNKKPHDDQKGDNTSGKNMKWLADKASHIVLHSKSSQRYIPNYNNNRFKSIYVPHLMYERKQSRAQLATLRKKYNINENDFVFLMIGFIKPYKHFEDGIIAFQRLKLKNAKIILAGKSDNNEYAQSLKRLSAMNSEIIMDLRYIPNITLNALLEISDVVVIPYMNESSVNSGVMIQAFSNEKTVIVPNICMAKDFAPYGFLYRYDTSLENAMKKAYENGKDVNKEMGKRAFCYIKNHNNEEEVDVVLQTLLKD